MRTAFVWLALPVISTAAPAAEGDWTFEDFRSSRRLGTASTIEIRNEHGDVRIRGAAGDEVDISAVIQRMEADPFRGKIDIANDADTLTIEVLYRRGDVGDDDAARVTEEMERRRVDISIVVPSRAKLGIRTDKGLIEAKRLENDVRASSISGNITLATAGLAVARTDRGSIEAILPSTALKAAPTFETVTGDVTVWLPRDSDVTVEAETSGEITTDYSIEIRRDPGTDTKHAVARIGHGKGKLRIKSSRGRVRLLRGSR